MLFSVFDTETTGLPNHPEADLSGQPKIIEFAGIVTDGVKVIDELEFKCNPGESLEAVITKITGLTDADLANEQPFRSYIPAVRKFFASSHGRVAHNLAFDRDMLYYEAERTGCNLVDFGYYGNSNHDGVVEICTVEQSFFEYGRAMKLQELIEIVKGAYVQKHRAMDDVLQLFDVAKYLGVFEVFA